MKINFKTCTEEEMWKLVATHLKKKGIDTVLVGGAVVSIYSEGIYKSGDLDFILNSLFVKNLPEVMKEIGFVKKSGRHYIHPECKHIYIEFPSSFLEIGEDNNIIPNEIDSEGVKIKILSPTDCVKDRLSSYIHFRARECFDQAVIVAKKHPVNLKKIGYWCRNEGGDQAFKEFLTKVKS